MVKTKRTLTLFRRAALLLLLIAISGACRAQDVVYTKGNVKIIQYDGNWQMLHGRKAIAHGEGTINVDNFAPLVQDLIDHFAVKPVSRSKSLSKSLSKSATVEPEYLIKTHWHQGAPYNNECPTLNGEHTPAGCVTLSSAQVLNYYRSCDPIDVEGDYIIYSKVESPSMTLTEERYYPNAIDENHPDGTYNYTYHYNHSYTPDFDKISSDDGELAKLIFAVAIAQRCYFDDWGSMTSWEVQCGAFNRYYGYQYDICEEKRDMPAFIQNAVKNKMPVLMWSLSLSLQQMKIKKCKRTLNTSMLKPKMLPNIQDTICTKKGILCKVADSKYCYRRRLQACF